MARSGLTFDDLVAIAKRTGVENWVDPATGKRGAVVAAPSSHRGTVGKMGSVAGVTRHHTGTAETFKPTEDYPTYQVVKEGRPGLVNSLSAYGLGRWWGIYVFSEDISWHAGTWSYAGITDGNGHFLGTEAEGTGAVWTAFQREFYPRLTASELMFIGEGVDMMPRHLDGAMPRGRKSDAANLWPTFTAEVQNYLDHPNLLTYKGGAQSEEDEQMVLCNAYRSDPAQGGSGEIALGAIGFWWSVPDVGFWNLVKALRFSGEYQNLTPGVFDFSRSFCMLSEVNDNAALDELRKFLSSEEATRAAASLADNSAS